MKLLGLLCFVALSYGKISDTPLDAFYPESTNFSYIYNPMDSNVWVMDLTNDWNSAIVTKANVEKSQYLYNFIGPLIKQYESRHQTPNRVEKDNPEKSQTTKWYQNVTDISDDDLRQNIFKLLNKFDMYAKPENSAYLGEDHAFSIALYFQGAYASLIMQSETENIHYFLAPPSLILDWFYEEYFTSSNKDLEELEVQVPIGIKKELLHQLQIIFSSIL